MSHYFTLYWSIETCKQSKHHEGYYPIYNYSNLFLKKEVKSGDILYSVNVKQKDLFLICSLEVKGRILSRKEVADYLQVNPEMLPNFNNYVLAKSATPIRFNRILLHHEINKISFIKKNQPIPHTVADLKLPNILFKFIPGVREITHNSSKLLDRILKPDYRVKITKRHENDWRNSCSLIMPT